MTDDERYQKLMEKLDQIMDRLQGMAIGMVSIDGQLRELKSSPSGKKTGRQS